MLKNKKQINEFSIKKIDKDLMKQAYVICMQDTEYTQLKDRKEDNVYNKYSIYSIKVNNFASKSIRFYLNKNTYIEIIVFETGWLTEVYTFPLR